MRKISHNSSLLTTFFSNPFFLTLWVVGCILVGIRLIHSGLETNQAFSAKRQAEDRLAQEEKKGLELFKKLENSESSLEKEKRIRDELNMQKPGEIILSIPSPSPTP